MQKNGKFTIYAYQFKTLTIKNTKHAGYQQPFRVKHTKYLDPKHQLIKNYETFTLNCSFDKFSCHEYISFIFPQENIKSFHLQ